MFIERRVIALMCLALMGSCAGAAVAGAIAAQLEIAPFVPALVGIVACATIACVAFHSQLARRLPDELDGWFSRRPRLCWLWLVAVVLAVTNMARLGVFIGDGTQTWASALPFVPESVTHDSLSTYVRAGVLAADGHSNLWRVEDYQNQPTSMLGMDNYLGSPYQYPPMFAVVPRIAVAATNDFQLIRALWFGLSAVGFWLAYIALAAWMRGRAGATALLLTPAMALSMPVLFALQWGQAHVVVVVTAVAGMMCFARGRVVAGGALLGFAVATKIFPGLLLVHLAVRRNWSAIAATLIALAALVALSAIVLGPATLHVFLFEQLPRITSGEAFAFRTTNLDNCSFSGLAYKLSALGIPTGHGVARLLGLAWGLVALALTIAASRGASDRAHVAVLWLAIICLGTLKSPFAPIYTAIGTLWLLAVAAGAAPARRSVVAAVAVCWFLFQAAPRLDSPAATAIAGLPAQLVTLALAMLAAWPRRGQRRQAL